MGKLIVDAALQAQLSGLSELTALTDQAGMLLGHFMPGERFGADIYRLAESQCPYTAKQLEEMRQTTGGRSLAEFWRTIGAK